MDPLIIFMDCYGNPLPFYKGPQSRTLQPVRGEGYEPAHKSRANAETHPRLGVGGCGISGGWWKTLHWEGKPQYKRPTTSTIVS